MKSISAWSISRLSVYESCAFRAHLAFAQRIPEPDRGAHPSGEWPNDRGTRIHLEAENFVKGTGPFTKDLAKFKPEFEKLRDQYKAGKVVLEDSWEFDQAWGPLEPFVFPEKSTRWTREQSEAFARIWVRVKLDAMHFVTPSKAVAVDYKTGRRFGNEVKHAEQLQFYQLAAFLRYPELQELTVELWYLDEDELVPMHYTRKQGLKFLKGFNQRGIAITTATEFPPRPSIHNCKYCPYKTGLVGKQGPMGTGHCDKNPA